MFGITFHFLDETFRLHSLCIGVCEMKAGHAASEVFAMLSDLFVRMGVTGGGAPPEDKEEKDVKKPPPKPWTKILSGCTDNASYFPGAFILGEWVHHRCVCHTLQLSIRRGLEVYFLKIPRYPALSFVLASRQRQVRL
jgi:hypothetical protein